jgi:hypothetical protein
MKNFFAALFILSVVGFGIRVYAEDLPSNLPVDQAPVVEENPIEEETPAPIPEEVIPEQDPAPLPTATFIIRSGETLLYSGSVSIPEESTTEITDSTGTIHSVSSRSVLALLVSLDNAHDEFAVTNLAYYSSFSSFYLKCLTPSGASELCNNWQYAVGSTTPFTSIDTTMLSGGETVGLYFGSPHRVSLNTTSVTKGTSFTGSAESYNYADNTWNVLSGVTIGVTVPNPNDPWTPTVVTTQAVDVEGKAVIALADAGEYSVGIAEDFYFPSYAVTVTEPAPVQTGGGGGGSIPTPAFSVERALLYLYSIQNPDGSFGSDLYTDWVAIAYAASGASESAKNSLRGYLSSHAQISSLPTDNERRAMAILSLGENPYSFVGLDYISPIISSFDGTQFGDASLVNDDIFALLPLSASGYSASEEMIAKDIQFLVLKQRNDGSWGGSVDLTAAAIQALRAYNAAPEAVAKAITYLQNSQQSDGGFGSVYSTSWAMQAGAVWIKDGKTPMDYLASMQASDGAAVAGSESVNNRVWATSYAIPAALGKSWSSIMHPVPKPQVSQTVTPSTVTAEEVKKEEKIVEKVEEVKPEEIMVEVVPEAIQGMTVTLAVAEAPRIVENYTVAQDTQEAEGKIIEPISLVATAEKSKADIPMPIIIGSIAGIGILSFIAKKLLLKL